MGYLVSAVSQTNNTSSGTGTLACPTALSVAVGNAIWVAVAYNGTNIVDLTTNVTVTDGTNNYTFAGYTTSGNNVTFTAAPSGSSGGTLTAAWPNNTGTINITLSTGQSFNAGFTYNSTAVTWSTLVTGSPTTAVFVKIGVINMLAFYALNCPAGSFTPQANNSGNQLMGIAAVTASGIATTGAYQGFSTLPNSTPGGTASPQTDGILTGYVNASQPAVSWCGIWCYNPGNSSTPTAGTTPTAFNSEGGIWTNIYNPGFAAPPAILQDAAINVSGNFQGTAGWPSGLNYDSFIAFQMVFAQGSVPALPGAPYTLASDEYF